MSEPRTEPILAGEGLWKWKITKAKTPPRFAQHCPRTDLDPGETLWNRAGGCWVEHRSRPMSGDDYANAF